MTQRRGSGRASRMVLVSRLVIVAAVSAVWLAGCQRAGRGVYVQGAANAPLEDVPQAVTHVAPAVVRIDTTIVPGTAEVAPGPFGTPEEVFPAHGQGSGMIVNGARGYVLTNAHVVKDARSLEVTLPDGRRFRGKALGADTVTDIALVQISGRRLPQVELGSSSGLTVGAWVIAVGNPLGLQNTVTAGVLSAKGRTIVGENGVAVTDLLQTDAPINAGNSGGALIDLRGQVVGMPTAIVAFAKGIGFAVAVDTIKDVMPLLAAGKKVPHAWLGIGYTTYETQAGAVVQQVEPKTPAAAAGLQVGDVIVSADGRKIQGSEDLARAIRAKQPGERLRLTIRRGGATKQIEVRLTQAPQRG